MTNTALALRNAMETFENVSLNALCLHLGIRASKARKARKTPITGEIYDPEATNWEALATCLVGIDKMTEADWEALNEGASPNLKSSLEHLDTSAAIFVKGEWYKMVYNTDTHVVLVTHELISHGAVDGNPPYTEKLGNTPVVWSWASFLAKRPRNTAEAPTPTAKRAPKSKSKPVTMSHAEYQANAVAQVEAMLIAGKTRKKVIADIMAADTPGEVDRIVKVATPAEKN